ncbi:hypothetical protein B0A53_06529, partial [Rhodotorula sp. CCFEE 5036]
MRFHVHAASCQLSSRPLLAGLFSLALLVLISHLGGPNPRRLAFNRHDQAHQVMGSPDLYISSSLNVEPDPEVVVQLLETLVTVPDDEVGEIAICASLRNEGRFIVEWLLYYRVLGVDRFYLYDSGSDDDTLEKLQPWLRAGTVKLHRFRHGSVRSIFIYIGATMPFASWSMEYLTLNWWRLTLLCLSILAFRRLPAMYALWHWIPDIKTRREAIFSGHFGPMGVGAIFISTLAATKLPTPTVPPETVIDRLALMIVPVTYCIVLTSILVHGLTISFFTLGRRMHSRVQSFSRTLTANSSRSGYGRTFSFATSTRKQPDREEPSWMARVKRATRAEDIIINRDEEEGEERPPRRSDESPESLAEK